MNERAKSGAYTNRFQHFGEQTEKVVVDADMQVLSTSTFCCSPNCSAHITSNIGRMVSTKLLYGNANLQTDIQYFELTHSKYTKQYYSLSGFIKQQETMRTEEHDRKDK